MIKVNKVYCDSKKEALNCYRKKMNFDKYYKEFSDIRTLISEKRQLE